MPLNPQQLHVATRQLTLPASATRLALTPSSQRGAGLRRPLRVNATKGGKDGRKPSKDARRPVRIVLVRHGESEGNVDERVYRRAPLPSLRLPTRGTTRFRASPCVGM